MSPFLGTNVDTASARFIRRAAVETQTVAAEESAGCSTRGRAIARAGLYTRDHAVSGPLRLSGQRLAPNGARSAAMTAKVALSVRAPVRNRRTPKMTAAQAAVVGLIHRYRKGLLDPFVTLLEVHKLMYFMQAAGEPLKLRYTKGTYGPYAENLLHLLHAVEGHFISGYAGGGDAPDKPLELVPGALEGANAALDRFPRTRQRFQRVASLVEGFESPFGLELLSTVHWILDRDGSPAGKDLVARTHAWNDRKRQFSPRQIELAADVLTGNGWVDGAAATPQH